MLQVNNLSLEIAGKLILEDISFELPPGEMMVVLGPNGAGKSTLLKSLIAENKPTEGTIDFFQQPLKSYSDPQLAELRAVMPQSVELNFPFTVEQVVEMPVANKRLPKERQKIVESCLAAFDVGHLTGRIYSGLSGGEKQRVQLARVMAQICNPEGELEANRYLFLDECTSSLDLAHQHQVFAQLQKWVKTANLAVFVILHDLNLAAQYADRILLLQQGNLVAQGEKTAVLQADILSEVYRYPVEVISHPKGWPLIISA